MKYFKIFISFFLLFTGTSHAQFPTATPDCCQGVTSIGGLPHPTGMAVNAQTGLVYLTDGVGNSLNVYDANAAPVTSISSWSGGAFNQPTDVGLDSLGNVYVADYSNARIVKFDGQLNFVASFGTGVLSYPRGLWVESNGGTQSIYITGQSNLVCRYDGSGSSYSATATFGSGLSAPTGLVKSSNLLYVADTQNGRVVAYDAGNGYAAAATYGGFSFPYNVKTDSNGNFYVEDAGSAQALDHYLPDLGGVSQVCFLAGSPFGMAAAPDGKIFVSEVFGGMVTVIQGCSLATYRGGNPPASGQCFIYPSPASGDRATVSYDMAESGTMDLKIWNDNGELAAEITDRKSAGVQVTPFDLTRLSPRVYFYIVTLSYDSGRVEKLKPRKFAVIR